MRYLRLFMLFTLILLVGCESRRDSIDKKLYSEKERSPGGTLVIGINSEPDALNPLTALSKPGRDVILLIETLSLNHRLKGMGYNSAKEFNIKLLETIGRKRKISENN